MHNKEKPFIMLWKKNKSEKLITYDELMNSHFIKFPNHSEWLHTFCQPIHLLLVLIVGIVITGVVFLNNLGLPFMMATIFGGYFMVHTASFMKFAGHGVGIVKKGKFSFCMIPKTWASIGNLVMLFAAFTAVIVSFFPGASPIFPDDMLRPRFCSVVMLVTVCFTLLSWRHYWYYETWHGDEYSARKEFKQSGCSPEQIEKNIAKLKKNGILF